MKSFLLTLFLPTFALVPLAGAQQARPVDPGAGAELGPCFGGGGGPNGDFDWVVRTGEIFFFDTTSTVLVGGPNGVPTTTQTALNGVVDVRNLTIEAGGQVRVQGPNPMRILATGDVVVRGLLDLSGFSARDVATINTGNQVEHGGAGAAGGGSGGLGNPVTSASSPRGGTGSGPFGRPGLGGTGGESAYSPTTAKNNRRPGGGGGGRFARDLPSIPLPELLAYGSSPSSGTDGHPTGMGAESGMQPARGGAPGKGAFTDPTPANDFWGTGTRRGAGGSVGLIRGELPRLWAGYGGGGGGNAIRSSEFPNPNWTIASDEKGGGGGGAAGGLQVQALGEIVFGAAGEIRANGGRGGTGENTNFLDHVGGTGGAGTGGHVVLESATRIDFTDRGQNTSALPRAWLSALGPVLRRGPISDVDSCCRTYSNGGAGGAGVIQLHVPDPLSPPGPDPSRTDIVLPASIASLRNPMQYVAAPTPVQLFPTCDPFPQTSLGWFGGAGRRLFERLLTPREGDQEPSALTLQLQIPR